MRKERELEPVLWVNRETWREGIGRRRKTLYNLYNIIIGSLSLYIYIYSASEPKIKKIVNQQK